MHILKPVRLAPPVLLVGLFMFSANNVLSQATPEQPTPSPTAAADATPQQPNAAESPAPQASPRVTSVEGSLELDDIIEVVVENLPQWAETNDASKLVPYINGRAIKGNYPEELHLSRGRLLYHLEIAPENKEVWTDLLGAPTLIRRPVTLSVGLEDGSAFDTVHRSNNPVSLTVISPVYGIIALVVILVTLVLLLRSFAIPTSFVNRVRLQPLENGDHTISGVRRWRSGFS